MGIVQRLKSMLGNLTRAGLYSTLRDAITWSLILFMGNLLHEMLWKVVALLRLILEMLAKLYTMLGIIFP